MRLRPRGEKPKAPDPLDAPLSGVDDRSLGLVLDQFRLVEQQQLEHYALLDDKVKGVLTSSSLLATALGIAIGSRIESVSLRSDWLILVPFVGYFLSLAFTFVAAAAASYGRTIPIAPNPHTMWRELAVRPPPGVRYYIAREMAKNSRILQESIKGKEKFTQWVVWGLVAQSLLFGAVLAIAITTSELQMTENQNESPASEGTPAADSPATPEPQTVQPAPTDPYAEIGQGVEGSIYLKRSQDDESDVDYRGDVRSEHGVQGSHPVQNRMMPRGRRR